MPSTDPRVTLRPYFDQGDANCKVNGNNLAYDSDGDGVDDKLAHFEAAYEMGDNLLGDIFLNHNVDILFILSDLGVDQPYLSASGPVYRFENIGIQACVLDKWGDGGLPSLTGTDLIFKATDEIYAVLNTYYRSDDKIIGRGIPSTRRLSPSLLWGRTVETGTKIYMATTSGTSRATEIIQRWTNIYIGYGSGDGEYMDLADGIVSFNKMRNHPAERSDTANPKTADTAEQGHSSYLWELILEGDCHDLFYTQPVTGAGGDPALVANGNSNRIGYFKVIAAIRGGDGTAQTRVYTLTNAYAYTDDLDGMNTFTYRGDAESISSVDT